MKRPLLPVTVSGVVVLLLLACIAGCTSQSPQATPVPSATPVPPTQPVLEKNLSTMEPEQMAVDASEIPGNFTLIKKSQTNVSWIPAWQINQGWKKGYYTTLQRNESGNGVKELQQFIAIFPRENSSRMVDYLVEGNFLDYERLSEGERLNTSMSELPSPGIGDFSWAFYQVHKEDPDPIYTIAFSRYDVFVEFWGNGTMSDYEIMKQAAATAAAKIQ